MFCLSGRGSTVSCDIFPPLELDSDQYVVGLVDLSTYNSIPNIETGVNDKVYIGDKVITLEEGAYEIEDIESAVIARLTELAIETNDVPSTYFSLKPNNNTLRAEIKCNESIDFSREHSIGPLLGFKSQVLLPGTLHRSDGPVNIIKVDTIRVECNIVRGSFDNGVEGHVLHEFYPTVGPGYKIVEIPSTILYLPVNVQKINTITVTLKDQDGRLINLRRENLAVRLHLKRSHGVGI